MRCCWRAFAVYYIGFPLRGYRWTLLLRGAGTKIRVRDSTEIIFISWLVNCLVPAKLGDVYRAYLLRLNYAVSLSRTFGTVFIERVFDLFAIVLLGLAAGFWSFRSGMSPEVQLVFGIGLVVIVAAGDRPVHRPQLRQPPRPAPAAARVECVEFYDRFEEGVFSINAAPGAAARLRHRAHLGDRGDAPLPRRRWRSASTSTWVSAARSSWR